MITQKAVMTVLQMFPSESGPVACKVVPCFYLTKASKGRGFCPPGSGAEKVDLREKPCIPGGHPGGGSRNKVRNLQRGSFREDQTRGNFPT